MRPCPSPRTVNSGVVEAFSKSAPHARSPPGMDSQLLIVVISILKDNHHGDTASLRTSLNRWTNCEMRASVQASMPVSALA